MNGYFLSFQHTTPVAIKTAPATNLALSDTPANRDFTEVTVVNDTDQDVKIEFALNTGAAGNFIVPKSIKGFTTRVSCAGLSFVLSSFAAKSMTASPTTTGTITFNFLG